MNIVEQQPVVGLFGTCGNSTWRQELFIPAYEELGIPYFNPQMPEWNPELIKVETDHAAYDTVQCWPVLGSTYGCGSLAEQGYSIASSLRARSPLPKYVIAMIEPDLNDDLTDPETRSESLRARKLGIGHMALSESPSFAIVGSLEEMLDVSITAYKAMREIVAVTRRHNPAYQRFQAEQRERQELAEKIARLEAELSQSRR